MICHYRKKTLTEKKWQQQHPSHNKSESYYCPTRSEQVILFRLRPGTLASYIKRWCRYAHRKNSTVSPPVVEGVNFLASLFQSGLGYSAICIAISALSCYLDSQGGDFGPHKHVRRLLKVVFELKPVLPKHTHIWV